MKKALSLILALIFVIGICASAPITITASAAEVSESDDIWTDFASSDFAEGSGTETDPYVIKTAEQLALMAKLINKEISYYFEGYYYLYNNAHYLKSSYILANDIDLNAHEWVPIANWTEIGGTISCLGFEGTFDGNGFSIANMHIKKDYMYTFYGLFGQNRGCIKNLILKDAVIDFESDFEGWQAANGMGQNIYVGGICGYSTDKDYEDENNFIKGVIENCKIENIKIDVKCAGLSLTCGGAIGTLNYSDMKNVITTGEVKGSTSRAIWVGGAIGSIGSQILVKDSAFVGKIVSLSSGEIEEAFRPDEGYRYVHYAGGFCGCSGRACSSVRVENCYAIADIVSQCDTGLQDVGLFAGSHGIIHDWGIYKNLYCAGSITENRLDYYVRENYFWQGERPSFDNESCIYNNCVVVNQSDVLVYNKTLEEKYCQQMSYSLKEMNYTNIFKDTLGFDESVWGISDSSLPTLKPCFNHIYTNICDTDCDVCGATRIALHDYAPANCVVPKTCNICGVTTGNIVGSVHITEEIIPGIASTCTTLGYTEGKKCSGCGVVFVEPTVLPLAGHITTLVGNKPATFEADGHTGNEVCTVCNQTINTGSVIPKLTLNTPTVTGVATNSGIQVNWNAVENAQGYVLYKRVYDASAKKWGKWQIINDNVTDVTYLDTDVTLGTSYRYTARAKYGSALSGYTSSATIKYNVTPTVKVANASNGIKVSWSTAANATGYTVYRSTYSNGKWSGWKNMGTAKANKTAWTDKNVKTGVAYKYTVRAAYGKVLSSYNKSGASVVFLNAPTVKIANNASGIKVAWNKIAGATGYVIYSSQYDPATNSWSKWSNRGTVNTNSWIDTVVQSGVTYKYTVRALNGKSLSAYVSSGALMYLAQPTVKIANAQAGINVSWSQSAGATGYTVYRSEYDAKTKKWSSWKNRGTATADKSSWVDKKVTSGKYYKYTVRAINGNAKSTFVSTGGMIFLAQPTITVSKDTNSNVISWNAVSGATGYRVFRKANGETNWSIVATVKNTSCSDTNVNDESTYTYTVRAYKGKVWSSYDINGVTINRNYKQTVLDLVNVERAKAGLAPLEYYYNGQLAGDIRANEIAQKFAHERPDGNSCFTVFKEIGVSCYSAGENIAMGFNSPEAVMDAWMNSPGHRSNILNPNFTHLIVGYDYENKAWVQLFLGNPYVQ